VTDAGARFVPARRANLNPMDGSVSVERRIGAPAAVIFGVLTDPQAHVELDGSGMVRATTAHRITGVGDIFTMAMHFSALGDYEMDNHVVEFELDRRIAWEPAPGHGHPEAGSGGRWGHRWRFELAPDGPDATVVTETYDFSRAPQAERTTNGGRVWLEAMAATLARLDERCR
jgi:uncharacterized protein YndB with AHSA1/START domain